MHTNIFFYQYICTNIHTKIEGPFFRTKSMNKIYSFSTDATKQTTVSWKRSWFFEFVLQNSSQRDNFCLSEDLKMLFQGQFKNQICMYLVLSWNINVVRKTKMTNLSFLALPYTSFTFYRGTSTHQLKPK